MIAVAGIQGDRYVNHWRGHRMARRRSLRQLSYRPVLNHSFGAPRRASPIYMGNFQTT